MIEVNSSIRYMNVVSRKYSFHSTNFNDVMEDFLQAIVQQKATIKGPLSYSINNVPIDEVLHVEFFMPIQEDQIDLLESMQFHSYFSIENMISYCLYTNFEKNTEVAYQILLDYIEHHKLRQVTPIFHIISGDHLLQYVYIKMGIASS